MTKGKINKILGPGVLFAATAIGVSHLVQSTTAGALYGFSMVGFIIAANVFKFPFFEYGARYAAATGKRLFMAMLNSISFGFMLICSLR